MRTRAILLILSVSLFLPAMSVAQELGPGSYLARAVDFGDVSRTPVTRVLDAQTFLSNGRGCYQVVDGEPVAAYQDATLYSQLDAGFSVVGRPAILKRERVRNEDRINFTMLGCFEPEQMWWENYEEELGRGVVPFLADVAIRWDKPMTLRTRDQLWRVAWSPGQAVRPEPWMSATELEQKLEELLGRDPWPYSVDRDAELRMTATTWWAEDGSFWITNKLIRDTKFLWWAARVQPDGTWELLLEPHVARIYMPSSEFTLDLMPWPERETINISQSLTLSSQGDVTQITSTLISGLAQNYVTEQGVVSGIGDRTYLGSDSKLYVKIDGQHFSVDHATPSIDLDGDGLSFAREQELGTSDRMFDTDGDASPDGAELFLGTDPTVADPRPDAPRVIGSTRGVMESDELLHYRMESDGINGLHPPKYWSIQADGMLSRELSSSPRPTWFATSEASMTADTQFVNRASAYGASTRRSLLWSGGEQGMPLFSPHHMARTFALGFAPSEVYVSSMHELPGDQGYIVFFDSVNEETPGFALLDKRFGLVGEPTFGDIPTQIEGPWRQGLFAAAQVELRRATSNPTGSKCSCNRAGCVCFFEEPGEIYIAAPQVEDNAQYLLLTYPSQGLEPGDVLSADHTGNLWRLTPDGARVLWLHTRQVQQLLFIQSGERPVFRDLGVMAGRVCLVDETGKLFELTLDEDGELEQFELKAGVTDASACAYDGDGVLHWGTTGGEIKRPGGDILAKLAASDLIHEMWFHPTQDAVVALSSDESLRCISTASGDTLNTLTDVTGAAHYGGLAYLTRRSGELVGAGLDAICTPQPAIEPLLAEHYRTGLWRQLHMGIMLTIRDSHEVNSPETEIAVRAPDHVLVALNRTDMQTTAYVGTVTPIAFRYAPSYPEGGAQAGVDLSEHTRSEDFFSLADDQLTQALAVIPGDGPAPVDYRTTKPGRPSVDKDMDASDMGTSDMSESDAPSGGGCAEGCSTSPAGPVPWMVWCWVVCGGVLLRRRLSR